MAIQPHIFIFIGRSGCGKGTQVTLLKEYLKKIDPERDVIHLETGKLYREFVKGSHYTHELSKTIIEQGGLQPDFLTINLWAGFFVDEVKPDIHVITDGAPRKHHEAVVLDSAIKFYHWSKPHVIYQNISRACAEERLLERGRSDDELKAINRRLDWFDTDVVKVLTFYQNNPDYFFHDINGERPVAEIHEDILERAGLKR